MTLSIEKRNTLKLIIWIMVLIFLGVIFHIYQNQPSNKPPVIPNNQDTISTSTPISNTLPVIIDDPVVVAQVGRAIGIAAGSKLIGISDEKLDKEIAGMATLGVEWVRFDIEWGFVQYGTPANHDSNKYEWSRYDRIVNVLNKYNLKVLPILIFTPEWARTPGCRGGSHCPPNDPKEFAKFAAEAVNRYKTKGITYWEIWNEPNSYDFWATKADCKAYTELLKVTYTAMKKADPNAFIITGGLAQLSTTDVNISALDFLQCIYDNGGKNYFDAVGDHPYTFPALPTDGSVNAWKKMISTSPSFRSIMIANGDSKKKIWMTEYGAPTNGPDSYWYISEAKQAQLVSETIKLYKTYEWAGPLFWYTYEDAGSDPSSIENFFGLTKVNGDIKPAYFILKDIINKKSY